MTAREMVLENEINRLNRILHSICRSVLPDNPEISGAHMTHAEVAMHVRMLTRSDLDHEAVCILARDRILYLDGKLTEEKERAKTLHTLLLEITRLADNLRALRPEKLAQIEAALGCSVINSPLSPSLDHFIPRSKLGDGELSNFRLAHEACNHMRGSKDVTSELEEKLP